MHSFQTALRKWSHTEGSMSMAARAELNEYLKRTRERYALPFNVVNKAPISESLVRDPWAHAHSTSSASTFKVWHQCRHITRASYRSCSYYCSCPLALVSNCLAAGNVGIPSSNFRTSGRANVYAVEGEGEVLTTKGNPGWQPRQTSFSMPNLPCNPLLSGSIIMFSRP